MTYSIVAFSLSFKLYISKSPVTFHGIHKGISVLIRLISSVCAFSARSIGSGSISAISTIRKSSNKDSVDELRHR